MIIIQYEGPLCPINSKYINRRYALSNRYRDAKESIRMAAFQQIGHNKYEKDIALEIVTYYHRKHDIDAFIKVILDGLEGVVYSNDSQIKTLSVRKERGKSGADIKVKSI